MGADERIEGDESGRPSCLRGGGEMGALMRAFDWARSPLGPVEQWPLSLRTMIGAVLGSRFPMLLWWGPDLLHLYNDAYRPILRDKHPAALAAPAAQVWAEIWDVVGPMAHGVRDGGPAIWMEDMRLFISNGAMLEETSFTYSYSPVPGDDGHIAGVLVTVQETTVKVQNERLIRLLHELSVRAADLRSEPQACGVVMEVLGEAELDLPFASLYALDEHGRAAQLVGAAGWRGYDGPAKPSQISLAGEASHRWPIAEALRMGRDVTVEDLTAKFGPLPATSWHAVPQRAVVLPLSRAGTATRAVLIAGMSPHRTDDERYRRALRAIADQVTSALASARAYQAELLRADGLTLQREVLERFFTLSLDLMCITGSDGFFKRLSPAFETLGYSQEELMARPLLELLHPDDVAPTIAQIAKLGEGHAAIAFENRYRCKDGNYRWISWNVAPDEQGTMYAIGRDVTEGKRAAAELRDSQQQAQIANRELEAFSYSVAHDLRAPLRSIDGFSLALLEDYGAALDDEGKRYLAFVRESAQRMAALIDDLLALSRVSRSELRCERMDLSALARSVVARLRQTHPDRKVEVTIEDGLTDEGDERLLGVVLENLIGNAWKFTARRDRARIEIGAHAVDGHRAYFVRDNGAGFDMAFAPKLFGVFQRLHATTEFEGTGIGLATVQRVIRRHDGHVWADGEVDRGATFSFTLHDKEDKE